MKKWYILSTVHMHHHTKNILSSNPDYREYTVIEGYPILIYSDEKPDLHFEDIKLYLEYAFTIESPFKIGRFSLHNMSDNIVDSLDTEFIMWPEEEYTFSEYCHGAFYANHDTKEYRQLMTPAQVLSLAEEFAIHTDDYK